MRQLFLDCDGVLADFNTGSTAIFGMSPSEFEDTHGTPHFWYRLEHHRDFYANLPKMKDAHALVFGSITLGYRPKILTAVPQGNWAEPQKRTWGYKHFPYLEMLCCVAKDKCNYAKPGDILIDDYLKYRSLWEDAGGIFIHHTSAAQSLIELKKVV